MPLAPSSPLSPLYPYQTQNNDSVEFSTTRKTDFLYTHPVALNARMSIFSLLENTALSGGFVNCNRLIYVAKIVLARTGRVQRSLT